MPNRWTNGDRERAITLTLIGGGRHEIQLPLSGSSHMYCCVAARITRSTASKRRRNGESRCGKACSMRHRATPSRDDYGRRDRTRTRAPGHAWRSALGTALLRADWRSDTRHFHNSAAGAGDVFDFRAGSEADPVGCEGTRDPTGDRDGKISEGDFAKQKPATN